MPVSSPQLVSCSATSSETLVVRVGPPEGGAQHVFVVKDHRGAPWRELEVFTVQEAVDAIGGPLFFNLDPIRVPILDQTFHLVSAFNPLGNIIRFYWNAGGTPEIRQVDYDIGLQAVSGSVSILSFAGFDPFIIDARPIIRPLPFEWEWDGTRIVKGAMIGVTALDEVRLNSAGPGFFAVESLIDDRSLKLEPNQSGIPTGAGAGQVRFAQSGADQRIYLMTVEPDGSNAVRQSFDLGTTWTSPNVFDPPATNAERAEANAESPFGALEIYQVAQQRGP